MMYFSRWLFHCHFIFIFVRHFLFDVVWCRNIDDEISSFLLRLFLMCFRGFFDDDVRLRCHFASLHAFDWWGGFLLSITLLRRAAAASIFSLDIFFAFRFSLHYFCWCFHFSFFFHEAVHDFQPMIDVSLRYFSISFRFRLFSFDADFSFHYHSFHAFFQLLSFWWHYENIISFSLSFLFFIICHFDYFAVPCDENTQFLQPITFHFRW